MAVMSLAHGQIDCIVACTRGKMIELSLANLFSSPDSLLGRSVPFHAGSRKARPVQTRAFGGQVSMHLHSGAYLAGPATTLGPCQTLRPCSACTLVHLPAQFEQPAVAVSWLTA
eukprot:1159211-Pelagomonas_calceolata.AAC.15